MTNNASESNTAIDLTLGLNLRIGSVPVSLAAEMHTDSGNTVYTFTGSVQDAVIDIGEFMSYVGQQFSVDVQLPPELDLKAVINYVAGQVRYTQPNSSSTTTEMGIAAEFKLYYADDKQPVTFRFYADTLLTSGSSVSAYVVGAAIDTDLPFKDLPLVGTIPVFNEFTLKHIGFSYTNADASQNNGKPLAFTLPKVSASANPLKTAGSPPSRESNVYRIDTSGDQTTFNLDKKGFAFTAGLMREGSDTAESNFSLPMALPPTTSGTTPAPYYQGSSNGGVKASPPATSVNWININKTFGPVDLQKIGLNYKSGEATFGLSAGFAMSGFSLALQGLCITFPLPLPGMPAGDTVSFDLDGMAMDFQKNGLNIGGAFLKSVLNGYTNYFGEVVVQVSNYGFKAIGGYAPEQSGNPASFFIYANLEVPLGGPPFLYVSGLAFGFGVNYALNLPTMETLPGYLLLPGKAPKQPEKADQAFSGVLTQLAGGKNPVISNQPGEYWVAAGVQFTSFNMISAFALVTVSFGVTTQVGLLGSCAITLPKGTPSSPLAYIEIDLVASFTPSTGALPVAGIISPASYLYGGFVNISGGFALTLWFSGEHKGDFVLSLGGYHPAYKKPDNYPSVPRLRMGFALGPFQASGTAYLAMTPSMFMAGMQFSASFSIASIRAWFNCGIDFLIGWAPFFYAGDAYVNVGCSVNLGLFSISVSVGANLQVWGPDFGGKADVDLDIVSFTIHFGSSAPTLLPVSWTNIEQNFLPGASDTSAKAVTARSIPMLAMQKAAVRTAADTHDSGNTTRSAPVANADNSTIVTASVASGLQQQNIIDAQGRAWNWIIDPNNFRIVTATSIPANQAFWAKDNANKISIPNVLSDYDLQKIDASTIPYLTLIDEQQHFSNTQVWNPDVSVKPMKLRNVQSQYVMTLAKADDNGVFNDYISEVQLQPVLGNSNTALWGDPSAPKDVNTAALLPNTLLGFNLIALPRNPDTVNNVPLIQLLFTMGNETGFSYTSQQSDTRYTVTSRVTPAPDFDLDITITGASTQSFTNRNYILATLNEDWVKQQRTDILADLATNGFGTYTPAQVDLNLMATREELTDWPHVGLLGKSLAA